MHDEIVKYPTAKLAKEKGFDLITHNNFLEDKQTGEIKRVCVIHRDELYNIYPAPTQNKLQKWLREVHDVNITPPLYYRNAGYACITIAFPDTIFYETYEDALEDELYKKLTKL